MPNEPQPSRQPSPQPTFPFGTFREVRETPANPQPAQPRLPRTVENFPREALALGQMQVQMGKLDNDPELVRNGENLIRRAQEVLARQGQTPKE